MKGNYNFYFVQMVHNNNETINASLNYIKTKRNYIVFSVFSVGLYLNMSVFLFQV